MKAFVTGATGFIGRHLVQRLLSEGDRVFCLVRDPSRAVSLAEWGATLVVGDLLTDGDWCEPMGSVDTVFHCAGVTHGQSADDYYRGNVECTRRIVEACLRTGRKIHLIHLSSLAAAGPCSHETRITESSPCRPVSHYGSSKLQGEQEVSRASGALRTTIIRPVAVYGPGDTALLQFFRPIENGVLPLIGSHEKMLNVIYVSDLVDGILLAARRAGPPHEVFFLGDMMAYTFEEIGLAIAHVLQKKPLVIHLPHAVVYGYAGLLELFARHGNKAVVFDRQRALEGFEAVWDCSIDKAARELGFYPKTPLLQGIQTTCEWYRAKGLLRARRGKSPQRESDEAQGIQAMERFV